MDQREPGSPTIGHLVEALSRLEADFDLAIEAERRRSSEADQARAGAHADLEQLRREFDILTARSHADRAALVRMAEAVRAYVEETSAAQRALLDLTRRALGIEPAVETAPPASPATNGLRPDSEQADASIPAGPAQESEYCAPRINVGDMATPNSDEEPLDGEPTDEHRLIDLQNRLDMNRLDAVSRLVPGRPMVRRRAN